MQAVEASAFLTDDVGPELSLDPDHWSRLVGSLGLSSQQARIVALILDGKADKQIAAEMGLRVSTVRTYLTRIFQKTGAADRVELILRVFACARRTPDPNGRTSSRMMTSEMMTSELTSCEQAPQKRMLPQRAGKRRRGKRAMESTVRRLGDAGFTLVELLVVIGIIAVLIAILIPVLNKARAAANRAVCLSNIRQLGIGVLMYCNDNKGWFPTCAEPAGGVAFAPYPDDWVHWQANRNLDDSAIAKYVGRGEKLKNLLRCPSDTFDGRKSYPASLPGQGPYMYSYSMNADLAENVKDAAPRGARTSLAQWRSPARKIMLTEGSGDVPGSFYSAGWYYAVPISRRHGKGRFHKNIPGNPVMSYGQMLGVNASAVFLDGHAAPVDQDFAYDPIHSEKEAR